MKLSPEKQKKLALTVIVMVALCFGAYYLMVQGLREIVRKNIEEEKRYANEIKDLNAKINTEKSNREQAKSYQTYILFCEEQMPKGNTETWLLTQLSTMATTHGLQIANTAMQPLNALSDFKFEGQPYQMVGFHFEFKGEFNQIGKFLEDLENSMPLLEVDEISIAAGSEVAPHIHTVSMRISMVTGKA